jgi:hypothetical protein
MEKLEPSFILRPHIVVCRYLLRTTVDETYQLIVTI